MSFLCGILSLVLLFERLCFSTVTLSISKKTKHSSNYFGLYSSPCVSSSIQLREIETVEVSFSYLETKAMNATMSSVFTSPRSS